MSGWLLILLIGSASLVDALKNDDSPYTYVCDSDKRCQRTLKNDGQSGISMSVCKLTCDDLGSLWPKPTGAVTLSKELFQVHPTNIYLVNLDLNPEIIRPRLVTAFEIFEGYIKKAIGDNPIKEETASNLRIQVTVSSPSMDMPMPGLDESYSLELSSADNFNVNAVITATTFFGARHALETLSQLIVYDEVDEILKIVRTASIVDKPVFPYRSVMLDTSRNYLNVDLIKKIIDGMSYNKLSVFHWHITDSHSFPMEVPRRPKMTVYGAYSPDKIYSVQQIKDVVDYARQRGIKVIPELDQPAHSGYGYQWGAKDNLGNLVVCLDKDPWMDFCVEPPCGQLNIVNENVPTVVGDIFSDMMTMFDNDIFHMGGDEVDLRCYNTTAEVTDWMKANGYPLTEDGFYRLWSEFQEKLLQKLLMATGRTDTQIILWQSHLTDPVRIENYLDKNRYIIEIWSESTDPSIAGLLQKGYRTFFANVDAMYLDCGWPAWIGSGHNWCSPVKGWQTVYDNDPEKIYASFTNDSVAGEAVANGLIMGSETPLWAEQVDDKALESRIWPRAAAHAERAWTHPQTSHNDAWVRMVTHRDRLVVRGIHADRLQPEYCLRHEGKCYA